MLARLSAFVIWALVAATAVFWGLRLFVQAPRAPATTRAVGDPTTLRGDLARLLGSAPAVTVATAEVPAAPEAASRFRLIGVMAPRSAAASAAVGSGVALIAVDGKAPKAYAVGSRVEEGVTLQSVGQRAASIAMGSDRPAVRLELAPLPPPVTGTLPSPRFSQDNEPTLPGAVPPPPGLAQPVATPALTPPAPLPGPPSGVPGRPMAR